MGGAPPGILNTSISQPPPPPPPAGAQPQGTIRSPASVPVPGQGLSYAAPPSKKKPVAVRQQQQLQALQTSVGTLKGVDLRLDNFDLSEAKRVTPEAYKGSWSCEWRSL